MEKLEPIEIIRAEAEAYTYPTEDEQLLQRLKKTMDQVTYLLRKFPKSRSNDFYLQWLWLRTFAKIDLPWLQWETISSVSGKLDYVTKMRRKIQHEHKKLLPLDPAVLKKRQEISERMRKAIKRL